MIYCEESPPEEIFSSREWRMLTVRVQWLLVERPNIGLAQSCWWLLTGTDSPSLSAMWDVRQLGSVGTPDCYDTPRNNQEELSSSSLPSEGWDARLHLSHCEMPDSISHSVRYSISHNVRCQAPSLTHSQTDSPAQNEKIFLSWIRSDLLDLSLIYSNKALYQADLDFLNVTGHLNYFQIHS